MIVGIQRCAWVAIVSMVLHGAIGHAGDLPISVAIPARSNALPEVLISQIEEALHSIPDTEERARQFPALKARFLEQFPKHHLRWNLKFLEGMIAAQNEESERQVAAESLFQEVLTSPESDPELKAKSSGLILAFRYKTFLEKKCALRPFQEAVEGHLKNVPNTAGNSQYARWLIEAVCPTDAGARTKKLQELTHSDPPTLSHAARDQLDLMDRLDQLHRKPVELRFTALDGRTVDLCSLRGKVVLVDFWATWSIESLALLPGRMAAYQKFKDQGFEIVGISFDEDKQSLQDFLTAKQISWPQSFDGKAINNPFSTQYGIEGLPVSWLLDQKGMLVHTDVVTGLEREVQKLLAK